MAFTTICQLYNQKGLQFQKKFDKSKPLGLLDLAIQREQQPRSYSFHFSIRCSVLIGFLLLSQNKLLFMK